MKKTVLVVGAGASYEFGLPLGSELMKKIWAQLQTVQAPLPTDGSFNLGSIIATKGLSEQHKVAAVRLQTALRVAQSIDRLLDQRANEPDVVHMGKLAIGVSIAAAESRSFLAKLGLQPDGKDHLGRTIWADQTAATFRAMEDNWLSRLLQIVGERRGPDAIGDAFENITFVTFNYDRCIEQYLYFALVSAWHVAPEKAAEIVLRKIRILHVYGDLDPLSFDGLNPSGFGRVDPLLLRAPDRLKTFTEQIDTDWLDRIRVALADAEQIVFLGFSFEARNCRLLFADAPRNNVPIWATMYFPGDEGEQFDRAKSNLFSPNSPHHYDARYYSKPAEELIRRFGPQIFA